MITAVFFLFISILLVFIKYFILRKKVAGTNKSINDIPRAGGLPIVGNIADSFYNEVDQWKRNRQRAVKYYPIYRLQEFNSNMVCLLDPDDIGTILGDTKQTSKGEIHDFLRRITGNGLVNSEGEIWHKRRKWLTKSFHFSVLKNYIHIFNREVKYLLERLDKVKNKPTDVHWIAKYLMVKIVAETIVGGGAKINEHDVEKYVEAVEVMLKIVHYNATKPYLSNIYKHFLMKDETEKAVKDIRAFSEKIMEGKNSSESNENTGEDARLWDLLLAAPHLFNEQEVKDEINTFLVGGQDGSSTTMSFTLVALANFTMYQEEIYQEVIQLIGEDGSPTLADLMNMNCLHRFIKESLRLYPPAPYLIRQLGESVITKTGYTLPAGTVILLQAFDIQRNPTFFTEPDKFYPERFLPDNDKGRHPFCYFPFSAGPRNCLAQKYSMLKMKACIAGMLQKFRLEPVDLIRDFVFVPNSVVKVKDHMRVKFVPRSSKP